MNLKLIINYTFVAQLISQIHIKNFKSIVDLTLDLGRVNLFIGENGSGKSNILEAVAFAVSTSNDIVNANMLSLKGVRITEEEFFCSAFKSFINSIEVNVLIDDFLLEKKFKFEDEGGWYNTNALNNALKLLPLWKQTNTLVNDSDLLIEEGDGKSISDIDINKLKDNFKPNVSEIERKKLIEDWMKIKEYTNHSNGRYVSDYMLYSPEVSYLRKFEEEGQIKPLGARGEGLFSLIKSLSKDNSSLQHIKEHLEVIDWFEDFAIPNDLMSNEYKISIKDRFINSELKYLDQRSANEGFLFLLFYVVLFSSKKTPQFFAIDNIEASFNPKLCSKLINMLVELSKKNGKQVLMTTHNQATLDGFDLNDPEQRLFVVERNIDGHTIVRRIAEKPKTTAPMKLSEMWTKGLLGGLPDNF